MPLSDQNSRVVDAFGQAKLVDAGLQSTLQEILHLQSKYVIELHAGFIEHTNTDETTNEGVSFEQTLRVLFV